MATLDRTIEGSTRRGRFAQLFSQRWKGELVASTDESAGDLCQVECSREELVPLCRWLMDNFEFALATMVVEEAPDGTGWSLTYVFFADVDWPWVHVRLQLDSSAASVPSLTALAYGPSADWHEREAADLFGLDFEGHPRLGEFVLHEDWPEGVNPMRRRFDAHRRVAPRDPAPRWEPPTIVTASGAFAMPIGPVFADFAESAHFLLETVGEDVIRTIPRFFYKYRGVEKISEGEHVDRVLLLAERFSGTAAFAHALAFCQAVEAICGFAVPQRGRILRTVFAELERLRHHAAVIAGICNATALAVAASQAAIIEEDLLRVSCAAAGHRYLFGLATPGGLTRDLSDGECGWVAEAVGQAAAHLRALHQMLRYSSSFLDRLEEVGTIGIDQARAYGLVGPIARASGVARDIRRMFPYAAYSLAKFPVPVEHEGDGYARLRVLFHEAEHSAALIRRFLFSMPKGPVRAPTAEWPPGAALGAVEAPHGAAFHWVRLNRDGTVARYRITPPSFANWHGFHLAAENFAFQDFPIILASFGLSNAECDR